VQGWRQVTDLVQHVRECCRYCHGLEHRKQWRSEAEYAQALAATWEANVQRVEQGKKPLQEPTDDGGYGFDPSQPPHAECPECSGYGTERVVMADTTRLEGPAAAIYAGMKETASGKEMLLHSRDKAVDRLLKCAGAFGDDAASVARGAAVGAAAGAALAQITDRAAAVAGGLDAEQAARVYLSVTG